MKYTIYKITNTVDNKIYIGKHQTNCVDDGYMGSGILLRRAQIKHGLENFVKEILHVFDTEEEMNAKEKELVTEEFCLREDTYNLCVGGQGGFSHIVRDKEKHRLYTSLGGQAAKKHGNKFKNLFAWQSAESIERKKQTQSQNFISGKTKPSFTGKTHTEETKQKMRKPKNIGEQNSQFGTMWITNGSENKKINKTDIIPDNWYRGRK